MARRPYNKSKRKLYSKYGRKKVVDSAAKTIQAAVRRAVAKSISKNIETKTSCYSPPDGLQIEHNNFIYLNDNDDLLKTTQGLTDPATGQTNNRIGDTINLRGVSIRFMLELNERYSDVSFRFMVIKCARGDLPTRATLFNGLSGNKMIDTVNTERYSVILQKWIKLKAPNHGTTGALSTTSGINAGTDATSVLSRATKIVKIWIPASKFVKSGVIKYDNNGTASKFFDYHAIIYGYSNYSTLQDIYYVGSVNDAIIQMYYKDA